MPCYLAEMQFACSACVDAEPESIDAGASARIKVQPCDTLMTPSSDAADEYFVGGALLKRSDAPHSASSFAEHLPTLSDKPYSFIQSTNMF